MTTLASQQNSQLHAKYLRIYPQRNARPAPCQRNTFVEQMENRIDSPNWLSLRKLLIVGCPVLADISTTQLLHRRLRGYHSKGRRFYKPEDQEAYCEIVCDPSNDGGALTMISQNMFNGWWSVWAPVFYPARV